MLHRIPQIKRETAKVRPRYSWTEDWLHLQVTLESSVELWMAHL